jgi:hypothetical protein
MKMKCENLKFNLSLYLDDVLTAAERENLDAHLTRCPLCRQKLDDFRLLRANLKQISRVDIPENLILSVKNSMRTELKENLKSRSQYFSAPFMEFLQMRVMPYTVGTAASLLLGFSLLWILLSGMNAKIEPQNFVQTESFTQPQLLIADVRKPNPSGSTEVSPSDLVAERFSVSGESPSVNPQGALIDLTKSLVRRKIKNNEMVVIADVFGNGLANIEKIVVPLDNEQAVFELEKALERDSTDAPFVPAFLDRRADSVRVVLKIQRVDVPTSKPKIKRK